MKLEFSEAETAFREEVCTFLDRKLSPRLRAGSRATPTVFAEPDIADEWQRILNEKGWLAYQWPPEHGGTGWTPMQRYIFEKECALAGAPDLPNLSLKLFAPVIQAFGTRDQQAYYLPRVLSGEDYWCQGFSEPQAGSDLANLKTRAVREGDHYVVNGSKLWTTHAQFANRMFCLVRTDTEVKAQRGISFLLIDLRQPGVEIRPILGLAGDHEVNAVFLDDVTVDVQDLVGEEGQGWTIAKFLLENERGGSCHAPRLLADLGRIRATADAQGGETGENLLDDPAFAAALGRTEIEAMALETMELRVLAELAKGQQPGPQTSLIKLIASTLRQQTDTLAMRVWGYAGLQMTRARPLYGGNCPEPIGDKAAQVASARYLNSRAWTIFGGTNEIQQTIIAKQVLGL
jgi:alkylation response protein AidB-like acyl-CoA dehydrogenase